MHPNQVVPSSKPVKLEPPEIQLVRQDIEGIEAATRQKLDSPAATSSGGASSPVGADLNGQMNSE